MKLAELIFSIIGAVGSIATFITILVMLKRQTALRMDIKKLMVLLKGLHAQQTMN